MKILLGLSGGLDSTYAAELLSKGHTVEGAVLVMHGSTDVTAAQRSAAEVGIPLHVIDVKERFEKYVISYFASEYSRGRTPNPCAMCNPNVKIGELCRFAASNGFDRVATGHYARSFRTPAGRYAIGFGDDIKKDQSYMLWGLSQEQIKMLMLPLGDKKKSDIRENARAKGLSAAESEESQDICFITEGDYAEFIEKRLGVFPEGNFIDRDGNILGRHKGIIHYTVGQRRGLGVATGCRMYISEIRSKSNEIVLEPDGGARLNAMTVDGLNFQAIDPLALDDAVICGDKHIFSLELMCKIRYAAPPVPVRVTLSLPRGDVSEAVAEVDFREPLSSVAPGQSAVFYRDGAIAFGGRIRNAKRSADMP